jgi:ferredoxin-NADP reductase
MQQTVLVAARMISSNVRELTFDVGPNFTFVPGQWVNLYFPAFRNAQGNPLKRAYSIASAPRRDGTLDLAVTRVADGPASTGLHAAECGQSYTFSGPHGVFTLAPIVRPIVMVATGTGIAPFRSMLQAFGRHIPQAMALLFGNRNESDILYRSEFELLQHLMPQFAFHPVLSRGDSTWLGKRGHVQTHLRQMFQAMGGIDCDVYVCGLAKMVQDVRLILRADMGMRQQQIHLERYD